MSLFTRWSVVLGAGVCLAVLATTHPATAEDVSPQLAGFLQKGELAAAEKAFTDQLVKTPDAHQTRFALGIVKVLSALEHLSQDQFRYGFISGKIRTVPAFRMPVPVNPKAEPITYQQARQIFVDLQKFALEPTVNYRNNVNLIAPPTGSPPGRLPSPPPPKSSFPTTTRSQSQWA